MKYKKFKLYKSLLRSIYKIYVKRLFNIKIVYKKVADKPKLNFSSTNDYLRDLLESGNPFMAARFGAVENLIIADSVFIENKLRRAFPKSHREMLCHNAGFFPEDEKSIERFSLLIKDCAAQADLLGAWNDLMEDYIIGTYAPQAKLTDLIAIEPYYHKNPWSALLKGKKVLVIHPFEESIQRQYQNNREYIFADSQVLPSFQLVTQKAVQTIAGTKSKFKDWFEALDYMTEEAYKSDFDVAIIGAGAYGFPLAARIKGFGKQAIHLAGATQLMFGIKGKRWDSEPAITRMYNDYWVRPLDSEIPENFNSIENGCYW